jgi:anthranilate phosphoribosyltransferase
VLSAPAGGDTAANVELVQRLLAGETGAHRDIVVLNAGAALVVAGVASTLADGVELAAASVADGRAAATLDRLVEVSQAAVEA